MRGSIKTIYVRIRRLDKINTLSTFDAGSSPKELERARRDAEVCANRWRNLWDAAKNGRIYIEEVDELEQKLKGKERHHVAV